MIDLDFLRRKIDAVKAEGRNVVVTPRVLEQLLDELAAARGRKARG